MKKRSDGLVKMSNHSWTYSRQRCRQMSSITYSDRGDAKAKVIGDLDILVVTENGELNGSLFESGVNLPRSVDWQRSGPKVAQGDLWLGDDAIHVDVWSCKPNERGAYLCFATGPVELNLLQRQRAIRMGYALSQIGLLDRETKWQLDNGTEEDIYRWIDMDFLTPEQREKFTKPKQATPKPYPQMTRRPIVSETTTPATRPTRKPAAKKAAEKPAPQVTEAPAPEPVTDASIEIGGVSVTVRQAKEALLALTAAKSMFVKQPSRPRVTRSRPATTTPSPRSASRPSPTSGRASTPRRRRSSRLSRG